MTFDGVASDENFDSRSENFSPSNERGESEIEIPALLVGDHPMGPRDSDASTTSESNTLEDVQMEDASISPTNAQLRSVFSGRENPAPTVWDLARLEREKEKNKKTEKAKKNKKKRLTKEEIQKKKDETLFDRYYQLDVLRPTHRDEPMTSAPPTEPSRAQSDADLRTEHLDYLVRQIHDGNIGPGSSKRRHDLQKFIRRALSEEDLLLNLNCLPDNDRTLKMEIFNQYEIPNQQMTFIMQQFAYDQMQACTRDLKIIKEKVQSSFPVFYEANEHLRMSRANDIELSQEEIIEISEITDAYNKLIEERTQKAIDALAYCFIRNVKVIRNRAHFTNCKDKRIFRLFEDSLDADITDDIKVIDEDSVSKRISEILTEKDLFLPDDSGRFFNLRRNPVTLTNFLWVTVRYTSDLENCKTFYARNFLLPEDVILEWRVNNTPPRQGLLEADVIIQLSLNRIPPKFIRGLTRELHAQKQWEEHPVAMLNGIQIVQIENPKDHAEARLAESLEQLRATCTMFMERRAMATQTNFLSRPRKANEQAFYMTSHVVFCHRFCHVCGTTDHSYSECTNRECKICRDPMANHPASRCPEACQCGVKAVPHRPERCRNGNAPGAKKRTLGQPPQGFKPNVPPVNSEHWPTMGTAPTQSPKEKSTKTNTSQSITEFRLHSSGSANVGLLRGKRTPLADLTSTSSSHDILLGSVLYSRNRISVRLLVKTPRIGSQSLRRPEPPHSSWF